MGIGSAGGVGAGVGGTGVATGTEVLVDKGASAVGVAVGTGTEVSTNAAVAVGSVGPCPPQVDIASITTPKMAGIVQNFIPIT